MTTSTSDIRAGASAGTTALGLHRRGARTAPLSFAQDRLWYVDQAEPGSATYNVPLLTRWNERVDVAALEAALAAVVARHEVLRTTYRLVGEEPRQIVADPGSTPVPLTVVDVTDTPDAWAAVRAGAEQDARTPFDLAGRPPIRATLWQGPPGGDAVLLTVHHIAVDGWSLAALFEDLAAGYEAALAGRPAELGEPPVQYADFAVWDRAEFQTPAAQRLLADRAEALGAVPAGLVLADPGGYRAGGPGAAVADAGRRGAQQVFTVPDRLWQDVRELAERLRATPFVVLLAAYQVVLQRWSGREEFLVGTVAANRPHSDLERLVGFFVNTVPLRCAPRATQSFRALCDAARTESFKALTYQRIPFDQLTARSRGRGPLAPVGFALQNMPAPVLRGPARWAAPELLPTGGAKFDLIMVLEEGPAGLGGFVEYDVARYSDDVAHRVVESFLVLLAAAVADPDEPVGRLPITPRGPGLTPGCVVRGADRDLVAERLARIGGSK